MLKRISVNPTLDMTTMKWHAAIVYWSNELCLEFKGDSTAQAAEQQQQQFDQSLMNIFQSQYSSQTAILNYVKGKMTPMIDNPTGYDASSLAAMRTSATDTISEQYQNATQALNNEENQKNGGSDLPAGTTAQLDAALLNSESQDKSQAQNTITMNDANLKNSNYWSALNVLTGNVAQQFNPLGYAGAATSGTGAVASASQAVTASQQSGVMGMLGGIAGGVFGAAGKAASGGATGGLSAIFGCWCAASFWGWESAKTKMVRLWMLAKAPVWFRNFYLQHGEAISKTPLRWAYRPVFEFVLRTV